MTSACGCIHKHRSNPGNMPEGPRHVPHRRKGQECQASDAGNGARLQQVVEQVARGRDKECGSWSGSGTLTRFLASKEPHADFLPGVEPAQFADSDQLGSATSSEQWSQAPCDSFSVARSSVCKTQLTIGCDYIPQQPKPCRLLSSKPRNPAPLF